MKKNICLLIIIMSLFSGHKLIFSEVKLPSIISNDMVLQRNSFVNLWGWADKGEKIVIKADWIKTTFSTIADENGKWLVKLKTTKAGGPYSIKIEGKNKIVLRNILLGEVWICSGQSNMEFSIKMFGGWYPFYLEEMKELEKKDFSKIRLCRIQKDTSYIPLDTCSAQWLVCSIQNVENFSATAYFFGRELFRKLNIPIGLISSNWGGTPAEAWTQEKYLKDDRDLNYYLENPNGKNWYPGRHSVLFNAMIYPLHNFTIKGVIWYQGESNRLDANKYQKLFSTMILNWRSAWKQGDFPFYFVQIAPFNYRDSFSSGAYLREAQLKTLTVPNTGMAVTMDIGDINDIHPKNKQEVGRRLALWALAKTYMIKANAFSGPIYEYMENEGNKIRLFFKYAENGFVIKGKTLTGFTIAGKDWKFIPAEAIVEKISLLVSNNLISDPIAVRFAFTDVDSSILFNKEGLPASSFRTDDKPFLFLKVNMNLQYKKQNNNLYAAMDCLDKVAIIRYTLDGSDPIYNSQKYESEIVINQSAMIKARAFNEEIPSESISIAKFTKHLGLGKNVNFSAKYSEKHSGGENALTNGLIGSNDFRDGKWQGYEGVDLDAVIDLGDSIAVSKINVGFLQDADAWIFLPVSVTFSVSKDGNIFTKIIDIENNESPKRKGAFIKIFVASFEKMLTRYVKINAKNLSICPEWHKGSGGKAWIFVDEIVID